MTAGSWIYIGSQGIVQGTYETLAAVARRHFGGSLAGRLVVTAGLGGMGGAQPLAATMNGAAALVIEVDPRRIARRLATKYLDEAERLRVANPNAYIERTMRAMAQHVRAMLALQSHGAITFDYGNNIRAQAQKAGVTNAFEIRGFVPEYIRPLFCEGKGPFRW